MPETPPPDPSVEIRRRRCRRLLIVAGVVLALVCRSLPPEYLTPCETLASICTMGVL